MFQVQDLFLSHKHNRYLYHKHHKDCQCLNQQVSQLQLLCHLLLQLAHAHSLLHNQLLKHHAAVVQVLDAKPPKNNLMILLPLMMKKKTGNPKSLQRNTDLTKRNLTMMMVMTKMKKTAETAQRRLVKRALKVERRVRKLVPIQPQILLLMSLLQQLQLSLVVPLPLSLQQSLPLLNQVEEMKKWEDCKTNWEILRTPEKLTVKLKED